MTSQPNPAVRETVSGTAGIMRWWPLLAAVAAVALLTAANLIIGASPPDVNATGNQVAAYYRDHSDAIRVSVWLTTLAMLPFGVLFAWLRLQIRGMARDVFLLGAAAYIIQGLIWRWLSAGLALHPGQLDAATARTFANLVAYGGPMLTAGVVLLAAPIAWASLRHDNNAPSWFGWLTVLVTIEQTVETITILGRSGFIAPGGSMNFPLGAVLFVLWIIACGAVFPAGSAALAPVDEGRDLRQPVLS